MRTSTSPAPVLLAWRHVTGMAPEAARQQLLDARPADLPTGGVAGSQLVLDAFRADLSGFRWSWTDAVSTKPKR